MIAPVPPPNDRLAGLVAVLGEADARELVQIFLSSLPPLRQELSSGDRGRSHRAAHSLKSSAQQMGVPGLADRMAKLEHRLAQPDGIVTSADLDEIAAELARVEPALRAFAGAA
jgi:HPt (histidine-containing phosphotransfer) domain-containing protein